MQKVAALFRRLVFADCGQDLTEYAMLAALIALAAVTTVAALGQRVHDVLWQTIVNNF